MNDDVKVEWFGEQILDDVRQGANDALLDIAKGVISDSVQIVPRHTHELANSAYADVDRSTSVAIAGYDVPRDVKTIKQHEDLTYRHPPGESAKFLEKPLKAARSKAAWRLAEGLRRVFR